MNLPPMLSCGPNVPVTQAHRFAPRIQRGYFHAIRLRGRELYTIVDETDAEYVRSRMWRLNPHGYAISQDKPREQYLHRLLLQAPRGLLVDHINGDKLDNRRCNIRLCTPAQNGWNRGAARNNKLGIKNVWHHPGRTMAYRARITRHGKRYYASFATLDEAANWARLASLGIHGQFSPFAFK